LFSYVSCEARVPADHPLRAVRAIVDEALEVLSPDFERLYSRIGRPSIAPEKLLRALLLQAFYSVRSERQLMQQLDYNLLFRWFVGLSMDAPIWDETVFTKTATGCWQARWRRSSWPPCCRSRGSRNCCRRSISRSTAP
jgi:transposase